MKKILLCMLAILTFSGCSLMMSETPTSVVEDYLHKYQTLDEDLLDQLSAVLDMDNLSDDNKTAYEDVMKRQYQDLDYEIKNEKIDGDEATVEVEVSVYDYQSVSNDADKYLEEHKEEFYGTDKKVDTDKYMEYRIGKLNDAKDKVTYTIYFTLNKDDNGKWKLNDLSEQERLKLHGLYTK